MQLLQGHDGEVTESLLLFHVMVLRLRLGLTTAPSECRMPKRNHLARLSYAIVLSFPIAGFDWNLGPSRSPERFNVIIQRFQHSHFSGPMTIPLDVRLSSENQRGLGTLKARHLHSSHKLLRHHLESSLFIALSYQTDQLNGISMAKDYWANYRGIVMYKFEDSVNNGACF